MKEGLTEMISCDRSDEAPNQLTAPGPAEIPKWDCSHPLSPVLGLGLMILELLSSPNDSTPASVPTGLSQDSALEDFTHTGI